MRTQTAVAEPRPGAYAAPEGRPLPLQGVRVTAEISGAASRVVMAQRYRNAEAVLVEAVYVFPLSEGAALCGLLIETAGRRINGRVLEREEAFAAYDPGEKIVLSRGRPDRAVLDYDQVRCNAARRGKGVATDHEAVAKSLTELLAVFRDVLADACTSSTCDQGNRPGSSRAGLADA